MLTAQETAVLALLLFTLIGLVTLTWFYFGPVSAFALAGGLAAGLLLPASGGRRR
jgi:hypothetical protein